MKDTKKLGKTEKISYGLGAVGKDMVYMFSSSYVLYYFQDILGVSAFAMGLILLAARIFDAFNDPIMGIIVAKTKSPWGKFRPWLLAGTLSNSVILYLMFAAPPTFSGSGLIAYAAVFYILWGITYTMMDIPFWSMVPAFTAPGTERENLSALARSCAGVGSAIVSVVTVMSVSTLGKIFNPDDIERTGFRIFALIVALIFTVLTFIMCICIKEKSTVNIKTNSVGKMISSLLKNDQAMVIVAAIVLINTALYITANLVIYFFKYDFSGAELWEAHYTLFQTCSGAFQILAMMLLFPLLRKFMNSIKIFYVCFFMAFSGYISLLAISSSNTSNVNFLLIPAFLIMSAIGVLNVIVTIFLANSVDYGEFKNGIRDESVVFSMQTFVVKLASGLSAFIASIVLSIFNIGKTGEYTMLNGSEKMGLRLSVTIIPMIVLVSAVIIFRKKYSLTDEKMEEITKTIRKQQMQNA